MASDLDIKVLGDFQVMRDGERIELPPSRKTRALLAYLAVVARPQRRERLCEMFWEVPDDPRGALRWSLSKIRGLLNDDDVERITADRNTVLIEPSSVRTDYTVVRDRAGADLDSLSTSDLRVIADSFRGGFLDDLSLPRCPEFEAWRIAHADEMELLRMETLRRLVDRLGGEPDLALPYAHTLQQLMPDDPSIPRLVTSLGEAARRHSISRVGTTEADGPPTPAANDETEEAAPAPEVRFCTTPDGVRVAYSVSGSGPAIVRAAHWMSHLRHDAESPVWRHWIRELSAENTLIRYDERGNGMSEWDVDDVSFEAMVSDLEAIVDASGQERVVLLGVSQSCAVSVAYAVRHPERVNGLVLFGGYVKGWRARGDPREIAVREALGTLMRVGWGQDEPTFRQIFTSLFIPGASAEHMEWFNDLQRHTVTPENAYRLAEAFGLIDVSDLLHKVEVPTLVIHARGDKVAPIESGKTFAAGIRGARFVELDTNNHILLEDEPAFEVFIRETRRFTAEVSTPRPARIEAVAVRRPVSVVVADIVSPLQAFESVDPELASSVIEPLVQKTLEVVLAYGGHTVDVREGVVTAAFGADRALEEHTVQACRAAKAIRDEVLREGRGAVKIRIGIDAGELVVRAGPEFSDGRIGVTGPAVKVASRIAGALRRDAVAMSARARESAGGFISAVRMQRGDCPGLARDEVVFELLAENKARSRWYLRARQGLTPLVGRTEDFDHLSETWRITREGRGRAVALIGNPGVGKSRLAHEFVGSEQMRGFPLIEAGAQEIDGAASHSLVKRILMSLFGLEESDDADAVLRTVRRRFSSLGAEASLLSPTLFVLEQTVTDPSWQAAQSPDRAKRIREAFVSLIRREAEAKPIVVLAEDLHWADSESLKALDSLMQCVPDRRIMLLMTWRPGFVPSFAGAKGFEELRLNPLPQDKCRAFVQALLGDDPSVRGLVKLICERTEGVPLFIEEIVGSLVQTRRLVGRPGEMRLLQPLGQIDIPASVQSVIAARLDKLGPEERRLLQIASVIGPVSPAPLLKTLSGMGDRFPAVVDRLNAAELLFEARGGPETEYHFKHALIQDATYTSLPLDRRRALHGDTLSALERLSAGTSGDPVERLAHHAVRAEAWERAARYLVAAADRAVARSAYPAAGAFLEQAAAALDKMPETQETMELAVDVRTRMRVAYMVSGNFETAIARLLEAQEIARRMSDPVRLGYTLLHTSYVYSTFGLVTDALAVAEEARAIGVMIADERHIAEADLAMAQAHMIRGEARPSLERLVPHRKDFLERWADDRLGFLVTRSVWFLGSMASTLALLGDIEAADRDIHAAIELAEGGGRPIDRFATAYFDSLIRLVEGPTEAFVDELRTFAEESRERAPFPFYPWLSATLGHCELGIGLREQAVETLERAFDASEQANMPHFGAYITAMLAVANADRATPATREDLFDALRNARESADRWIEIEVLRALAEITEEPAATEHLELALEVAREAGYRRFEDRIRADLDRHARTGRLSA